MIRLCGNADYAMESAYRIFNFLDRNTGNQAFIKESTYLIFDFLSRNGERAVRVLSSVSKNWHQFIHNYFSKIANLFFLNPQPIGIKDLKTYNPQILCVYLDENDQEPKFIAVAEKAGFALGAIFKKGTPENRWMGKIGRDTTGLLRNDPRSERTRTIHEVNIDAIREKLASDLYQELGRGLFIVPETGLSKQPVMDEFTSKNELVTFLPYRRFTDTLRFMSRFVEGYSDFAQAKTEDQGTAISFMDYIKEYHRPPETLIAPCGASVPLWGIMSLLAVGRVLADIDLLQATGTNAGFVWIKEKRVIIAAQTVKIDPGYAFTFAENNWVIAKNKKIGCSQYHLADLRDLQTAPNYQDTIIDWNNLTERQTREFLAALLNCNRYLNSDTLLTFLFQRERRFSRSETESFPENIATQIQTEMQEWMLLQMTIYKKDMDAFKGQYPEELVRIHYVDHYGKLSLPMLGETCSIQELFTKPTLIDSNNHPIALENLFDNNRQMQKTRKVILQGNGGSGKSTLCQKIVNDWASGYLWNERFQMVYWLPAHLLNNFKLSTDLSLQRLLKDMASHLFNRELDIPYVPYRTLVILDGYDKAEPSVKAIYDRLLQEPTLDVLLTLRPDEAANEILSSSIDHCVQIAPLSNKQVVSYAYRFFFRTFQQKELADFVRAINSDSNLLTIVRVPLVLEMLCSLWEQKHVHLFSHLTGLYQKIVDEILHRNTLEHLLPKKKKALISCLGEIGQDEMAVRLPISHQSVKQVSEKRQITEKHLKATDLICQVFPSKNYAFLHVSIRDYLVALSIAEKKWEEQKAFILENCNKPDSELVLAFFCGILYKSDKNLAPWFFSALCESFDDNTPVDQMKLLLKCINECPDLGTIEPIERYFQKNENTLGLRESSSLNVGAFHYTIAQRQIHAMRWLYERELDVSLKNETEPRGMLSALWNGSPEKKLGVFKNSSIFAYAVLQGNLEAVKWLYKKDPSLFREVTKDSVIVLHAVAEKGPLEMAQWLVAQDHSLIRKATEMSYRNSDQKTLLHSAAKGGQLKMAQWLVSQDPSLIQKVTDKGWTPLHIAAQYQHLKMAQWLVSQDPSLIQKVTDKRWTPLHIAAQYQHEGWTPLHIAAQYGQLKMAQWLVSQDPLLIQKVTNDGLTPLHIAAKYGRLELAQWLVAQDGSLIQKVTKMRWLEQGNEGWTPLHIAAKYGQLGMAKWLVAQDHSLIRKLTNDDQTPLHLAAECGNLEMVKWLCEEAPEIIFREDKYRCNASNLANNTYRNKHIADWLKTKHGLEENWLTL